MSSKTGTIEIDEKEKKSQKENYQDLLQKTIEELAKCKAQLKNTERDYLILQMSKNLHLVIKQIPINLFLNRIYNNQNKIRSYESTFN